MKVYAQDYNGVLGPTISLLEARGMRTDNIHRADVILLWQDVRGAMRELATIAKTQMDKPVVVMQHGRGATRDYCPPNSFSLVADRILVWGETEKDRLLKQGIAPNRVVVVGCPLFSMLKPRTKRTGKNVLFVPIIAQKEEPENLLVYARLKAWESGKLIESIKEKWEALEGRPGLKKAWATEENHTRDVQLPDGKIERRMWRKQVIPRLPRFVTYEKGLVNVKATSIHDVPQYMAPLIVTGQGDADHLKSTVDALANTDVMVCLEEGTMQLLAAAMDIPIICVDIFKYGNYGGTTNYDSIEKIHTGACYWTQDDEKVGALVDRAMAQPDELRKHRIEVCEREGGAHLKDIPGNIIRALESVAGVAA